MGRNTMPEAMYEIVTEEGKSRDTRIRRRGRRGEEKIGI